MNYFLYIGLGCCFGAIILTVAIIVIKLSLVE